MQRQPVTDAQRDRIAASVPFVEALARRVAATMPHSIDISDLVQDGMIGLIDAANRYDEARGIKFETFAERRVRGAMIDALRRDAWPRGVRRMRRQLAEAREELRRELGCEPSMADLAARIGSDEARLNRTIVRINTIESTSPMASNDSADEHMLPAVMLPPELPLPDREYEKTEVSERIRAAMDTLPARERLIIGLYYFDEVTMKQIGQRIGVNESRVSQLHARAVSRLRKALAATDGQRAEVLDFLTANARKPMARATLPARVAASVPPQPARPVVVNHPAAVRAAAQKITLFPTPRPALEARRRSARRADLALVAR